MMKQEAWVTMTQSVTTDLSQSGKDVATQSKEKVVRKYRQTWHCVAARINTIYLLICIAISLLAVPLLVQSQASCKCSCHGTPSSSPVTTVDGTCASVDCQFLCFGAYTGFGCDFGHEIYQSSSWVGESSNCSAILPSTATRALTGRWTVDNSCDVSKCCCLSTLSIAKMHIKGSGDFVFSVDYIGGSATFKNPGPLCGSDTKGQGYRIKSSITLDTALRSANELDVLTDGSLQIGPLLSPLWTWNIARESKILVGTSATNSACSWTATLGETTVL